MRRIIVADAALCKIEEENRLSLLFREKASIAAMLDDCGVDIIELPPIRRQREDSVIYRTISSTVKHASIAVRVDSESSAAQAYDSIHTAVSPMLEVVLPVSTVRMEYMFHLKEDAMLQKIAAVCSAASSLCPNVLFVAEDSSRADLAYLQSAFRTAIQSGAKQVMLCDSAGICTPEEMAELTLSVRSGVSCPLYVETSDSMHMASAAALSAIRAGADGVRCSAFGNGILPTDHFADLLKSKGPSLEIGTGLIQTRIRRDILQSIRSIRPNDPSPSVSGQAGVSVFLDIDSTISDIKAASESLGYSLSEEDLGKVYAAFQKISSKKGTLGSREIEALIASSAMQVPATYHLTGYNVSCSNITSSMAHVVLNREGKDISGLATGDGPIDAAFRAIDQLIGFHYELDDFQIRAVTEGKESLGETLVKLRCNGTLYSGSGLSTDIVGASIRAYINAVNKIVAGE